MARINKQEINNAKWRMAWDVMKYLYAHPDIMEAHNNREIYNYVREMRIRYFMAKHGDNNYSKVAESVEIICQCEIKYNSPGPKFDQETLECFRPNALKSPKIQKKLKRKLERYVINRIS